MCGVVGFVGKGSREDLERMTKALAHRGPDDETFYVDTSNRVYLGHRRLSILDLSTGAQPIWNEDHSICVVYNGEIYNHRTLRRDLLSKQHVFSTDHSDTEILVHGYEEWGERLVNYLNGMWAFAIYDKRRRLLFLSRDRFGKKPLYYFHSNGVFAFASELRALMLHSRTNVGMDALSLKKYFAYGFIPAPRSVCKGIFKLPGGFNLTYRLGEDKIKVSQYWEFVLDPFDEIPKHPEEAWGEELRRLLSMAVQRRLEADVPLGIFLSGGIDSSAVLKSASLHREANEIQTFSIGFEEESFDESRHSNLAARSIGSNHHHCILSLVKAKELVPFVLSTLDEPIADGSVIPTYLLSRFTKKSVTVALSGDGGDELFAGYDPFKALALARFFNWVIPGFVRKKIRSLADLLPISTDNMSIDFKLKRGLRGLCYEPPFWNSVWLSPLEPSDIQDLFNERTDIEELYSEALTSWHGCAQKNLVDRTLAFYTKLYLQDDILVKVDRTSMMVSLEVRSPFLDIDFVDFVRRIPWAYKYRRGRTKYILKKAFEGILPEEIIRRPKKGFGIPLTKWLREEWDEWRPKGMLSDKWQEFVKRSVDEHRRGKRDHRLFLWADIVIGRHMGDGAYTEGVSRISP